MSSVTNPAKPKSEENKSFGGQAGQRPGAQGQQGGQGQPGKEKDKESMASSAAHSMQDAASYIGEKAKSATSSAMHSAEDAASYVGKKADEGLATVGSSLKSFGDTVRHTAPGRDMLKDGMCAVADTLENTGKYLEEEGLSGIAEDVTSLIKRNPVPALFVGIGIGFLLARALSSRSY